MRVLVTGGGGFLGGAIVEQALVRGWEVRSYARGDYPALTERGVRVVRGDLTDAEAVRQAVAGCDLVFHVAARPGVWGSYDSFFQPNVVGTRNVLAACLAEGVGRLVYTSSPSVVFNGTDMEGVDESVPYPDHYSAHYPETKAIAEREVLAANGKELLTVSLRPHLIWGPKDNHLVPRIVARGKAGQLRKIGKEAKLVDSVYIDNAADAHLAAADRLLESSPPDCAGRAYFISNGEPMPVWDLVNGILAAADAPPVTRTIPRGVAMTLATIAESTFKLFGIQREPRLTRFVVEELCTAHWFDLTAAKRDLHWEPAVSIEEGLARLREDLHREEQ